VGIGEGREIKRGGDKGGTGWGRGDANNIGQGGWIKCLYV